MNLIYHAAKTGETWKDMTGKERNLEAALEQFGVDTNTEIIINETSYRLLYNRLVKSI